MSLAKAAFSGKVYREPQKRSTGNNIPITYFTFDIGEEGNEELIRVRAVGNLADNAEKIIRKNDRMVIEGNLMMSTVKAEDGSEKRIVELALSSFEKIATSSNNSDSAVSQTTEGESLVKFSPSETEDLIGEDEIPF